MNTRPPLQRGYSRALLALLTVVLTSCGGAGGFSADGGVSGSGVSAVTGTVAEVSGGDDNVAGIRVVIQGTEIETVTGDDGSFELMGDFDGPVTVVFELTDGERAAISLNVPTGGEVTLDDVTIDLDQGEARPARQSIDFEGVVEAIDCLGEALTVLAGADESQAPFVIRLEDAFLHDAAGAPVACAAVRPGSIAAVAGEVLEDDSIGGADVEIRRPPPTPTGTPTPAPEQTLVAPRPTTTPSDSDRPVPTATAKPAPDQTRVAPRPTSTPRDNDRPTPTPTPPGNDRPNLEPTQIVDDPRPALTVGPTRDLASPPAAR